MKRWRWALLVIPPIVLAGGVFAFLNHARQNAEKAERAERSDDPEREARMIAEAEAAMNEFAATSRKTPLARMVSPSTLGSSSSRALAHRDLAELRRLSDRAYDVQEATLETIARHGAGRTSPSADLAALLLTSYRARRQFLARIYDLTQATLVNADEGRAELVAGRPAEADPATQLAFDDQAHEDRGKELHEQLDATLRELEALQTRQHEEYQAMLARQDREVERTGSKPAASTPRISPLREAHGGIGDD